ncbi:MAG: ABC transporter permease, partial [Vicinamibacterales bacterium]
MDRFRPDALLPLTPVAHEILLALADGEQHGYRIMQDVNARAGTATPLHAGSLYRAAAAGGDLVSRPPADRLIALALLAYPAAFRRRFAHEMLADFRRDRAAHRARPAWRVALAHVRSGLAERWAAAVRWWLWPASDPHLYEPGGRTMTWDTVTADLRYTLRQAVRAPLFTALAVIALAVGIGANSAVFTVVNAVLLEPLPYGDPDALVMVWSDNRNEARPLNVVSPANFVDYRDRSGSFAGMDYALSFLSRVFVRGEETGGAIWALRTGPSLFGLLGREAALGRTYGPGERGVAVISHELWLNRFGGDRAVVGRPLTLSGDETLTIVGVMPPDFAFPYRSMFGPWATAGRPGTADMWIPMPLEGERWTTDGGALVRNLHALMVLGRLRPDVGIDEARAELGAIGRQLEGEYPRTNEGWGTTVLPLTEQTLGDVRPAMLLLLAGVGVVLLMAAVNVANLLLARGVSRQREFAVRAALGASRARMVRQTLTESLVLSLAGGALGLLTLHWIVQAFVALAPAGIPRLDTIAPDARVVAITLGVAVCTGLLVGLVPAFSAARDDVRSTLQDQSRGTVGSGGRRRARAALIVAEMALAVLLTIGAGLLLRSFARLVSVDAGLGSDAVLTLQLNAPDRLTTAEARRAFYETWMDRLEGLPGVLTVGGTTRIPLGS